MGLLVLMGTLFLLAIGFFCLKKSVNFAAGINSIWWAAFIIMAFALYDTSTWNYTGMLYIEAICACALLGSEIGRRLKCINSYGEKRDEANQRDKKIGNLAWLMLFGIVVLALAGQVFSLKGYGYSLSDFSNAEAYISMNTQIAYNRYNTPSGGVGALTQILLVFSYVGPLCGGYCLAYAEKLKGLFSSLITLVPIIFGMMFTNTKAGFIASVMLFAVGFLAAYTGKNRHFINIDFKMIALLVVLGGALFLILFAVMCIRVGDFSDETITIIKNKFAEYAVGQMQAFELWFENLRPDESKLEWGCNTFLAVADKLGLKIKVQGVYDLIEGASSNIFTAIRGVVTDFGLFGGLLFYLVTGMLGGMCEKKIKSAYSVTAIVVTTAILFYYLYGFIISPWIYTSYILAFVSFYVFCLFAGYSVKCQKVKLILGRKYVKKIETK